MEKHEKILLLESAIYYFNSNNRRFGICHFILENTPSKHYTKEFNNVTNDLSYFFKKYFPTFYKYKPKSADKTYWFPLNNEGYKKRIEVLKKLIYDVKADQLC